jgi:hypothetical protein
MIRAWKRSLQDDNDSHANILVLCFILEDFLGELGAGFKLEEVTVTSSKEYAKWCE